jgi:heme oxygenase
VKKIYEQEKALIESTIKALKLETENSSVRDRLRKAQELTKKQLELFSVIDMPQKNSLDGKYKQQLNEEIKNIEEEKSELLSSILNDGFDPVITVMNEHSQNESMKLSAYFKMRGLDPKKYLKQPSNASAPKKVGKFTVYSGGNDSGGMVH